MSHTQLFTIGYATKPMDTFIEQIHNNKITVIADIRSVPYSKIFHDYHRESLKNTLKSKGISYVYLGDELGPRSKIPDHYDDKGQVQFKRLMRSPLFQQGIERLRSGIQKGYQIALLCAEKDPSICHRSLLVGYYLLRNSEIRCEHIGHDGTMESQQTLERRLMDIHEQYPDFISTEEHCIELAYQQQCQRHAYRLEAPCGC